MSLTFIYVYSEIDNLNETLRSNSRIGFPELFYVDLVAANVET